MNNEVKEELIEAWKKTQLKSHFFLKYMDIFFVLNWFLYFGICLIYPVFFLPEDISNISVLYDVPYYVYVVYSTIFEALFL